LSSVVNFIPPVMCSAMVPEIVFSGKVSKLKHQASTSQSVYRPGQAFMTLVGGGSQNF